MNTLAAWKDKAITSIASKKPECAKFKKPLVVVGIVTGVALAGSAGAVDTNYITDLGIASWLDTVLVGVSDTMKASAPKLYTILTLIGGFFFVWNRVRSLW